MESKYIQIIASQLNISLKQVSNIHDLHIEGSSIPFISRYRKEATGNLNEVIIGDVINQIKYFNELEKRKDTIRKTIEEAGKLSPELRKRIDDSKNAIDLEDIYLPYKPKRKTRSTVAIEKGLEPLARLIFGQDGANLEKEVAAFITEKVKDSADALHGARDIIAEWIAEDENARNIVRKIFTQEAVFSSHILTSKKDETDAQKYRDYFEYQEPLGRSPSHRVLAIRRGEKEGFLIMEITIDKGKAVDLLKQKFVTTLNTSSQQVAMAIEDSYNRLIKPSIETEFRLLSKTKADEEAIRVFAENLRQLLHHRWDIKKLWLLTLVLDRGAK